MPCGASEHELRQMVIRQCSGMMLRRRAQFGGPAGIRQQALSLWVSQVATVRRELRGFGGLHNLLIHPDERELVISGGCVGSAHSDVRWRLDHRLKR